MDPIDQDGSWMGDWVPTEYPTDDDPSSSPYEPQSPWSGYPAAPTPSDLVDVPPTPTDVVLFSSFDTGVGRYYSSVAIPPETSLTPELPSYIESIPTSTPEPPPAPTVEITTPEPQPEPQPEEPTSSSEIIPAPATPESTSSMPSTTLSTTSSTTTSNLSSIPQSTSNTNTTTNALATSPSHDNTNRKKTLAVSITVPIVVALLVALGAIFFLLRRRRRRRTEKATTGAAVGGSGSEADTLTNGNGDGEPYLHYDGQYWGVMPTTSHDVPFSGPAPSRKPVPLVTVDEPTPSPLPPPSRSHTLRETNSTSQTSGRGVEPQSRSHPETAETRYLPLIHTSVAAKEVTVTGSGTPPRSTFNDPGPDNDAVSDISDRGEGPIGGNGRDLGDVSPVSSISEDWDQAYTMRYTAGQAAHVHIQGDHPRPPPS